ncbi:universal stress protein [Microvirga aerophila]|uniref:Universal stress protein A n=1 Tax=Microvirga aerophila TaxID=670291 RepID=A0A512BMD7_9HYPH|nr:universal stress protein [Microvirga aerophila]GEO13118.1 universal stress protein A [Microvirga aerophila]
MLRDIRNILIAQTEEGDVEEVSSAVAYGLSLATQADAHVTVQAASLRLLMPHAFVSGVAAGLASAENQRLGALANAVAEAARQAAATSGLSCTTESPQLGYRDLVRNLAGLARTHDLTVLDAEPAALATDRGLIEAVLTDSGRPLVIVPPGRVTFACARIVVAWDGSAKAARALNDALPFLHAAESVELVSVTGEKDLDDTVPGADAAVHLARHGIEARVSSLPALEGDVAETLRQHASVAGADLIVMGAFAHSRLRQMVLGGTTQSLLKNCPAPLFLSF